MKRKLLCVSLSVAMAISMAGCGLFGAKDNAPDEAPPVTEASKEVSWEKESEKPNDSAPKAEREPFSNEGLILVAPEKYSAKTLYLFDTDGSLVDTFDIASISDELNNNDKADNYSFRAYCDGILFFEGYKYEDGENYNKLTAYDYYNRNITDVIYWGGDSYSDVEVYDGKLNITVNHDYNDWSVKSFEKDENSLSFRETAPKYADIYEQIGNYNIYNSDRKCCLDHFLDKNKAVVGRLEDSFYLIRNDGSIEECSVLNSNMSDFHGDSKYGLFSEFDDSYNSIGLFSVNMETGEKTQITDLEVSIMDYEDGILYYTSRQYPEFEVVNYDIYSYNTATGENTLLFEKKSVPGTELYEPVITGFTLGEGKAFYTDLKSGKARIFYADVVNGKLENETDTGCETTSFSAYDYGTVEYKTIASYCPNCGIPLTQAYAEIFVLDPKYSEKADSINETILSLGEGFLDNYKEQPESWLGEAGKDCEQHKLYPQQYDMTDTDMVDEVGIIDDRYLYVNKSGYWYGGGAHGSPSRDQLLFDLSTGQQLKLTDFYKGTEEEYKKLVAEKTKEDFESYDPDKGMTPYFAENAQDVYDQAYEYVQLDMNVYFETEGIIYYFYPYDMGSYADGFRDIFIPYKELLGRDTLKE